MAGAMPVDREGCVERGRLATLTIRPMTKKRLFAA